MTSVISSLHAKTLDSRATQEKQPIVKAQLHSNLPSKPKEEPRIGAAKESLEDESDEDSDKESGDQDEDEEESNEDNLLEKMIKKEDEAAEESSSSDEDDEEINMDEDYKAFVEQYGHLDFHLLRFLPKIKTKSELLDTRKRLQDQIEFNKEKHIVTKNCERMARFQVNSELG